MPLKTHLDEQPSINLTPMIDVVFLLIIFFMVGAKFTEVERDLTLRVPAVSNASALSAAPERRVVNVYGDGRVSLDQRFVTLDQLRDDLRAGVAEYAELGVVVRGESDGRFQHVASVLNAIREAGVSDMGIAVLPLSASR